MILMVSDLLSLLKALSSKIQPSSNKNIGIDGASGVGKTTLALQIQQEIGGAVIHIDDYVKHHKGAYWDFVQWQGLSTAIELLKRQHHILIFDGLCLLKILDHIAVNLDFLIYVRRIGQWGVWSDDWLCEEDRNLDEILARIGRIEKIPGVGNCDIEIAKYHHEFQPLGKANYVFDRLE